MANSVWEDDSVQFPRLLAEIMATQDLDYEALCESMDLDETQINELFDRAQEKFEEIKERLCN